MTICFFLHSGKTFTFKGVTDLTENQTVIEFTYRAMSDANEKEGKFYVANIAGWSKFNPPDAV